MYFDLLVSLAWVKKYAARYLHSTKTSSFHSLMAFFRNKGYIYYTDTLFWQHNKTIKATKAFVSDVSALTLIFPNSTKTSVPYFHFIEERYIDKETKPFKLIR